MKSRRKRVLLCANLLALGGIENHIINLCRLLAQNGADVAVVTRIARLDIPGDELRRIPVQYLATPFRDGGRRSTIWAMVFWPWRLARTFDVLYTFDLSRFSVFLSQFVRPGGFVLGAGVGCSRLDINTTALRVLDGMLLETELQAEWYRDLLPAAAIPHLAQVTGSVRREARRVDELHVAFLGRLDRYKGLYRLLDLWPKLDIQPARLDFYGAGSEFKRLESEIRTRALRHVHLHGAFTGGDLPNIFTQTDLVVLPSESEGLPLVLMESMAYGVPFVATDVGAIRTLAENNPDVCVVPLNDTALKLGIEKMARAIRGGQLDGMRLQRYHGQHYSYDYLATRWLSALLQPEEFWDGSRMPGTERRGGACA